VTQKVTVDVTTVPPSVKPANLFDLTFNDPNVGIWPSFEECLGLPQIAGAPK